MDALVVELIHRVEADLRALIGAHEIAHHSDGGTPHVHDDPEEIRPAHEILHTENETAGDDIDAIRDDIDDLQSGSLDGELHGDGGGGDVDVSTVVEAPVEAAEEAGDEGADTAGDVVDAIEDAGDAVVEAVEDVVEGAADIGEEAIDTVGDVVDAGDSGEEAPERPHPLHRRIVG